jgi:hypothetical protein
MSVFQYNALLNFADDGHDNYAALWTDTNRPVIYYFHNQTQAIYLLLAGIEIANPLPFTSASPIPTDGSGGVTSATQSANSNNQRSSIVPLLGASVGGLISLIIILLTIVFILKRKRRQRYNLQGPGKAPEDPIPAIIVDTKGISYFPNIKVARAAQSPIDTDVSAPAERNMAHENELSESRTSSERETGTSLGNRDSGTHDQARPQNLTPADLLQILNHPTGNLVDLLSQHVRQREDRNDNEPLPVYGNSEFGSG